MLFKSDLGAGVSELKVLIEVRMRGFQKGALPRENGSDIPSAFPESISIPTVIQGGRVPSENHLLFLPLSQTTPSFSTTARFTSLILPPDQLKR